MNQTWNSDPRLRRMDPRKLQLLDQFSAQLSNAPSSQKLPLFLELNRKLSASGLAFSPEERSLLFTILTENMSPGERKQAELIRDLAARLSKNAHI